MSPVPLVSSDSALEPYLKLLRFNVIDDVVSDVFRINVSVRTAGIVLSSGLSFLLDSGKGEDWVENNRRRALI